MEINRIEGISGEEKQESTRIALIGIIVEDMDSVEQMNRILHEAGE